MEESEPGRSWGVVSKAALLSISLLICLALLEGGLRMLSPDFFSSALRCYDPTLGWRGVPGQVMYRVVDGRVIRFATNGLGFRDRPHTVPTDLKSLRPAGGRLRRIAVLGDSFLEAAQVELEETFPWHLRRLLNSGGEQPYWEVQSYGVGDYGTTQEWIALEQYASQYPVDLVVVQMFPMNDVLNNSISGAHLASNNDNYRPYLDPETDFERVTYLNPITNSLRRRSFLFRSLVRVLNSRSIVWGRERVFDSHRERFDDAKRRAKAMGLNEEVGLYAFLLNVFTPVDYQLDMVREGWDATEASLTRIQEEVRRLGARLMVIVVPHIQHMFPLVNGWQSRLDYPIDRFYAEERVARLGERLGFETVPLLELFESNLEVVRPFVQGHFNPATHEMVGEVLFERVAKLFPQEVVLPSPGLDRLETEESGDEGDRGQ